MFYAHLIFTNTYFFCIINFMFEMIAGVLGSFAEDDPARLVGLET